MSIREYITLVEALTQPVDPRLQSDPRQLAMDQICRLTQMGAGDWEYMDPAQVPKYIPAIVKFAQRTIFDDLEQQQDQNVDTLVGLIGKLQPEAVAPLQSKIQKYRQQYN